MLARKFIKKPINGFPSIHNRRMLLFAIPSLPLNLSTQVRQFRLSAKQISGLQSWGFFINVFSGIYIGTMLICGSSLYLMYYDANDRQKIPFELTFDDQVNAVKAINKDDVLNSPRYAAKHYRRLLINIAKREFLTELNEEEMDDYYAVPLLPAEILLNKKSASFANFYVDIVLRYAKSLIHKGETDASISILQKIINDDKIFYKMGEVEKLSQCSRLLAKISPKLEDKLYYLKRDIDMIQRSYSSIFITSDYIIEDKSRVSDELLSSLNDLAAVYALESKQSKSKSNKEDTLEHSLSIYLANLKKLKELEVGSQKLSAIQTMHPLFDCDPENVKVSSSEIEVHIGEILWAMGYKSKGAAWCQKVVDELYSKKDSSPRIAELLKICLELLSTMYDRSNKPVLRERTLKLLEDVPSFNYATHTWYESFMKRFSRIMYNKGPLGLIEKPLKERFGPPIPLPEIEEMEDENEE